MAIKFGKNARVEGRDAVLRVTLGEYKGAQVLHVRVWVQGENGRWHPTRRGLTMRPQMWAGILPEIEAKLAEWRAETHQGEETEQV